MKELKTLTELSMSKPFDPAINEADFLATFPPGTRMDPPKEEPCPRCDGMGRIVELKEGGTVKAVPAYPHYPKHSSWDCANCGGRGMVYTITVYVPEIEPTGTLTVTYKENS